MDTPEGNAKVGQHERRRRVRRKPSDLSIEIEPLLAHVEPEVRDEIRSLIKLGKRSEAEALLLKYVVLDDRGELVHEIIQKRIAPIERGMSWKVVLISMVPVIVVLYCIWCLLTRGHVEMP
jgi:hypothetical protein